MLSREHADSVCGVLCSIITAFVEAEFNFLYLPFSTPLCILPMSPSSLMGIGVIGD